MAFRWSGGFALILLLLMPAMIGAATINVSSISALNSAISSAAAGDTIILANGSYSTTGYINVNRVGTSSAPITIKAGSVGGVTIGGSHGFSLNSGARYIIIQGFNFTHTSGRNIINSNALNCRFSRCTFQCTGDGAYLVVAGHDAQVDYCEFRNKSTVGNMIDVRGSGSQIAQGVWVHHNYFHDFTSPGANGAETVRWGLSGLSLSTGDGLLEHNLFVRCNGENETISIKSSDDVIRYNTILDCPGAQLTQRHGNDNQIYGNYLKNTNGIRIFGDRHQVHSNYLEGNTTGIDMGNGDGEVADGAPLTSHDRPDNVVVSYNTMINNSVHYKMGGRTDGLGALNIIIRDNIMQGGTTGVSISSTAPHTATWGGNYLWNVGSAGNIPSSGYTVTNPLLSLVSGVYHLQSGSPAINSGAFANAAVTTDQDGQTRSDLDKGADEFSTAAVTAKLLTTADVGPAAGTSGGGTFDGFYRIMARHSGKAAVVQSAATTDGADIIQWTYGGSNTNDEWDIIPIGGGFYRIDARHSGKSMVVQSASTAEGADVIQWTYGGSNTNDEWSIVDVGGGYFRIVNRLSGKALNVEGASTSDGADITQRTYTGATNQQWQIIAVP